MSGDEFGITVRTPRRVVLETNVLALRVPTETGQVGLRPRCEPIVLAIEPGVLRWRAVRGRGVVATAGGLLHCDGRQVVVLTPIASAGDDEQTVMRALEGGGDAVPLEWQVRRLVGKLQERLWQELTNSSAGAADTTGTRR